MVRVRPMTAADLDPAADLTTQLGYPVDGAELGRRLAAIRGQPAEEVLVAVGDDDRPIGWIHVARLTTLEASDRALIGGLVVHEAHRSAGIGASLVAAAEAWARQRGAVAIVVRSRIKRERAHRFYEQLGYRETKRGVVFEKPLGD
jgi:GNAT superfamily N-acetyltransferase